MRTRLISLGASPNGGNWDVNTFNWNSGSSYFTDGDNVTFGSTGSNSTVNIATRVQPSSITIAAGGTYTFITTGMKHITAALLTVSGNLTISNNAFFGNNIVSTTINAGGVLTLTGNATPLNSATQLRLKAAVS
jgi:hypothetical protein